MSDTSHVSKSKNRNKKLNDPKYKSSKDLRISDSSKLSGCLKPIKNSSKIKRESNLQKENQNGKTLKSIKFSEKKDVFTYKTENSAIKNKSKKNKNIEEDDEEECCKMI